jgi:DNA modification methylase
MTYRSRIVGHGYEDPEQLLANPSNWRIHPKQQEDALAGVLSEVGWVDSVLVNKSTGFVVDGHLRVAHAISHGEKTVPVTYLDLTEHEEGLVLGTFDPITALAGTDQQQLDALLATLSTDDQGLSDLLTSLASEQPKNLNDDTADLTPPTDPITKPGDLWIMGDHRLLCGDSTKAEDVARLMGDDRAAMLWTDPPYGVEYVGGTADKLTIDNDYEIGLAALLIAAFANADAVMRPGAVFYIAHPDIHAYEFIGAVRATGWTSARPPVVHWVKDSLVLGRGDYHARSEPLLYGWKPGAPHHAVRDRTQDNLWEVPRSKRSAEHPTMKPPELIARAIVNSSDQSEVVLDIFGGAGSTVVAAEQSNRRAYLMDIDPAYCDVTVRRWETLTGHTAVLESISKVAQPAHTP